MSDVSSDDFSDLSFSFSAEDLARVDASIEAVFQNDRRVNDASFAIGIGGFNAKSSLAEVLTELDIVPSQTKTIPLDDIEEHTVNTSFASDTFELNIGTLSALELELIDTATSTKYEATAEPPSVQIELEDARSVSSGSGSGSGSDTPQNESPLKQFRSNVPLSVTDLCAPSWCEVQFDYGLRGMRSRPLAQRPKSFTSSSGKTISPAASIAQDNEITTKQGQTIHKELEREIKYEELRVEITTEETRWALRLVNMLACLRGIMTGFTREMPVFGILHGEVVVGIMDEVVKGEVPVQLGHSPNSKSKRPFSRMHSATKSKRMKTDHKFQSLDRFFESPKKAQVSEDSAPAPIPESRTGYVLYIKDSKTRRREFLPSDADMYSGQIQLMIYRRLLSELVSINPPYDFKRLWDKLNIDPAQVFPTQFLVQAKLIEESDEFTTSCLDDLVNSWHNLVKEFNIVGVDPQLELIYRLQPPRPDRKGKARAVEVQQTEVFSADDEDLAKAIAASLEDISTGEFIPFAGPSNLAEPVPVNVQEATAPVQVGTPTAENSTDDNSDSEDAQLQWALQQSILPQEDSQAGPSNPPADVAANPLPVIAEKGKSKAGLKEEAGIHRFKIIGTKKFRHDDLELDRYLSQVLAWWRGERKPKGVSLEHSYRCRSCEYAEDCEWRAEKALEYSNRKNA